MVDKSFDNAKRAAADQSCVVPFYLTGEVASQSAPLIRGRLARLFSCRDSQMDPAMRTAIGMRIAIRATKRIFENPGSRW